MASMKIEVSEDRELILSDVFSGIGIKTDQGRFGIAQRDGGIEIVKDGKIVWSSTSGPRLRPASISSERPFTPWVNVILRRADDAAALSEIPFVDSLFLLLGILDTAESPAGKVLEKVGCVLAVRTEASAMASTTANVFERQEQGSPKESSAPESEKQESYPPDWKKVELIVAPNGEFHCLGGDREPGEGDQPVIGFERLRAVIANSAKSEDPVVRKFDEADEAPDYTTKHAWEKWRRSTLDRFSYRCKLCDTARTVENVMEICPGDAGSRALTQLGGCLLAAEGCATGTNDVKKGDYGWSPAFQAVKELWNRKEKLRELTWQRRETNERFHTEICQLKNTIAAQREEMAQMANDKNLKVLDDVREALEAEQAANADKVQIIDRQCRERQAIRTAAVAGDMDRLREILFPPESDEPESIKKTETEIKTVVLDAGPDHLKIVEIENVTALRAERDYLTRILRMCELVAEGRKIPSTFLGTRSEALQAVMTLREDRDRIRAAITGLREKILAHVPCICGQGGPLCHRHEIEDTLDDFCRRAGVGEVKGPERNTDDVTSPSGGEQVPEPCATEKIMDKLVIRFDGPPGPVSGRFVETEINGQGVNAGEWVQDGEYWLLVIRPDVIPPKKRPGDLASRRCEHILALIAERDRLRQLYDKAKAEIIKRAPCTCSPGGGQFGMTHEPDCRLGIALTEF